MPASTLRLLGDFAIETASSAAPLRLGRKARALLACAAMQGGAGASRGRLIALLWTDQSDEDARSALRQCLHLLRRELGAAADGLDSDGDRIVLRESAFDVDVRRFEALASCGDQASMLAAADLYRGDFVDALDAGAEFARWAETERQRLRDLAQGLLERLSESAAGMLAHEATVQLARRLLASDPLHEGSYRALMRLHARAGLRAKALQAWSECRSLLRRELDIEPSAQTRAVIEQLRADSTQAESRGAPARPGDDPAVVDMLLRGWQLFCLYTAQSNAQAQLAFKAAIARASDNAEAIALLGWSYWIESISGWSADPALSYQHASACASRAIGCNRGYLRPLTLMGKVLLWRMQHEEAVEQMRRALSMAPGSAYSHFNLADTLMWCGRCDEALGHLEQALALEPNDHGVFLTIKGKALWMLGRLDEASDVLGSAIRRNPTYAWSHGTLAAVCFERGATEAAREAAATGRSLNRRFSVDFASQVLPYRNAEHRQRMMTAWRESGMPRRETAGGISVSPPPSYSGQAISVG